MEKLLLIIVLVLAVIAIAQLARVYDLTRKISGRREEDILEADNNFNARMMYAFVIALFIFFIALIIVYKDAMLPEAASIHGVEMDKLLNFNWIIIVAVFFSMNFLLFYFSWKYRYSKDRKAYWFPHDNKLEFIWTIIPAAVMCVIIIYGLMVWNDITGPPQEDAIEIQVYGKQFDWTVRYAGEDGELGESNYNFISAENALGIINQDQYINQLSQIEADIASNNEKLTIVYTPDDQRHQLEEKIERLERQKIRILGYAKELNQYTKGDDDIIVKQEFYIPLNKEVVLRINSRDVIHSVYLPHFRTQMNAVPGMTTSFKFTPTITTLAMKEKTGNPEFEYILLCNKICGASHYNMQMTVKVVEEAEFNKWLSEQKTFVGPVEIETEDASPMVQAPEN